MTEEQEKNFRSIDELKSYLEMAGVPVKDYGQGKAKTLEHLFKETQRGECFLIEEGKDLIRKVKSVSIFIYYQDEGGNILFLKESKQVFKDGRERNRDFEWSVSEKLEPGESKEEAVKRAMSEELGIFDSQPKFLRTENKKMESPSYPGLVSYYETNFFKVYLSHKQYHPGGYQEEQPDKTTYWVWEDTVQKRSPFSVVLA